VLTHGVVIHFYAHLAGRSDRAFRALVTGVVIFLAILNQWAPLRGTVLELRAVPMPWGTGWVPIRTPPGASLVLLFVVVYAASAYGLFVAAKAWKRDRTGAVLVAVSASACLVGISLAALVDFAHVRAPYPGAVPHAIFVVCMAVYLSREYAARGARLVAEQRRREESEAARQRAMEAVVEAQRKELASHLAAGVAHDFNNVLNVISLWSQALIVGALPPPEHERARRALADAQAQGQALSHQLMALARSETRAVKRFPLDRSIRTTAQTLTPALPRSVRFEFDAPAALEVEADEVEIQQVIYNLVLNARDMMPEGGAIQVTGGVETSSTPIAVVGGTLAAGRWTTLSVKDSGPGVAPEIRERIFELFFTTKDRSRGTGLGLATVLRIAKEHGGGVALESTLGQGATFRVYLPACGPEARPTARARG
jgi:signal transduction histidine kinase